MSDDLYEDEFTAVRKRRQHEAGVEGHGLKVAGEMAALLNRSPEITELGETLAAEIEVSAARLSRIAELERKLGNVRDALRKACDRLTVIVQGEGGSVSANVPEMAEWRKLGEER